MVNKDKSSVDGAWSIRKEYDLGELCETALNYDPFSQFKLWYDEALKARLDEPNAMALASADRQGNPSVRFVLLKGFDSTGFRFFTNYNSRKAQDLDINPAASLAIYWRELERQVRIEGQVKRLSLEEGDQYFNTRPRQARIGAIASNQSKPLSSRAELEERFNELEKKYPEGAHIPRPDYWGGYILQAKRFEFWQGRVSRLHDRFEYLRDKKNVWTVTRLWP